MEKRLKPWGNNRGGQLGDGTWTDFRTTATTVLGPTSAEVVKIAAGGAGPATGHGPALLTDRTVQSWGANGSGPLGNGTTTDSPTPVTTLTALTGADKIAARWAETSPWPTDLPSRQPGVRTERDRPVAATTVAGTVRRLG
ncbi:hypothetical protein [Kitasatospora paranensis]|uniref:Uncharacterized protein n=1 Tax=Kitasatospora paranensis TaxID=258053 RepID=A0ABW2FLF3_9ACTN